MRIAIDATPAAVQRGGVGRYARELLRALVSTPTEHRYVLATAAPEEQAREMVDALPPGSWRELRRLPLQERWMTAVWQRLRIPIPAERLIGPHDVYHGTDFTLPPGGAAKVVTIHDLSFILHPEFAEPSLAAYLSNVLPRSIARADAIITVSASVAREVAEHFPESRSRLVAIPNGVRMPVDRSKPADPERPLILMVGTVEPRKNHRAAIAAIDIVRQAHPDARLVLVGRPGWRSEDIQRAIRDAVAQGGVEWHADASDDDLERAWAEAAVVISPSHYEGFGLPVLEAMARAKPVVASDIPAHREAAGNAALFAPPAEHDALAAHIIRLLDDADWRRRLGASGREHAANSDWTETARRTQRVYEQVGGRRRP